MRAARPALRPSPMTLLADVVAASTRVADTSSRSEKVAILAALLARLDADEVAVVAGLLSGAPRQGRVGVGYSTIYGVECEPAAEPSLTVSSSLRGMPSAFHSPRAASCVSTWRNRSIHASSKSSRNPWKHEWLGLSWFWTTGPLSAFGQQDQDPSLAV